MPRHLDRGLVDREPAETLSLVTAGEAGDIQVFDADLPHGATRNRSGARRRSLLLSFMEEGNRATMEACRAIRNVRMGYRRNVHPLSGCLHLLRTTAMQQTLGVAGRSRGGLDVYRVSKLELRQTWRVMVAA